MASTSSASRFVCDGQESAHAAALPAARLAVETEYAERLAEANWLGRWLLRWEMMREVERRLERIAPSDALYLCCEKPHTAGDE